MLSTVQAANGEHRAHLLLACCRSACLSVVQASKGLQRCCWVSRPGASPPAPARCIAMPATRRAPARLRTAAVGYASAARANRKRHAAFK